MCRAREKLLTYPGLSYPVDDKIWSFKKNGKEKKHDVKINFTDFDRL